MITSFVLGLVVGVLVVMSIIWMRTRVVAVGVAREGGGDSPTQVGDIQSSNFLAEVLDALTIGVVVASADGAIVYRNARASGSTRAMHSEVLVEEAVDNYVRAAVGGQGGHKILDLFGPPRQVISVTALPLVTGGAVAMIEDTTERALADAVRTDFVANISHELKTPIGAMSVLAETLCEQKDPDVVARLSAKISDEAMRVGRLIDDLLELSRLEYGGQPVMDVVHLNDVIDQVLERTQTFAEGLSITIVRTPCSFSPTVSGDRRTLVSAVQNLVENAIKFSEAGSSIDIGIRRSDGLVMIDVVDHGIGIPAKEIDRIFERFYRVDRARSRDTGGTGLGLAIARHIAVNHGGDIVVSSIEGRGSTFTLTLPEFLGDAS